MNKSKIMSGLRTTVLLSTLMIMLAACGLLASCTAKTPEAQLKKDIKDYKKTTELGDSFEIYNLDVGNATKKNAEDFFKKVKDFDYDIEEVKTAENGETATINVCITTYDFGTAYLECWDSLVEGNKVSTDTNKLYQTLFAKLAKVKEKNYSKVVTVNCAKDADGNWETDITSNQDFQNAVYGGMMEVVAEISKLSTSGQ